MKSDHDLSGLFPYTATDDWSDRLKEALGDHFGLAMIEFDLSMKKSATCSRRALGADLVGCAFEDLPTRGRQRDWRPTAVFIGEMRAKA